MIPVSYKDILKEYADISGMPYEEVKVLYEEYAKAQKNIMRNVEHPRIKFNGLGWMQMLSKKLDINIDKVKADAYNIYYKFPKDGLMEELNKLERVKSIMIAEAEKRTGVWIERERYKDKKKNKHDTKGETTEGMG